MRLSPYRVWLAHFPTHCEGWDMGRGLSHLRLHTARTGSQNNSLLYEVSLLEGSL